MVGDEHSSELINTHARGPQELAGTRSHGAERTPVAVIGPKNEDLICAFVGDVRPTIRPDRDARRIHEFPEPPNRDEGSVGSERLDPIVPKISDADESIRIDHGVARALELPGARTLATPLGNEAAIRRELLDPV